MATLTEPVPDVLSPAHWKVLLVVADTIVAELTEEETQKILVDSRSIAVTKNIRACKDFAKLKFSDDSSKYKIYVYADICRIDHRSS